MRPSREHRSRGTLLEELPAVRFQPLPHNGLGGSGLRTGHFSFILPLCSVRSKTIVQKAGKKPRIRQSGCNLHRCVAQLEAELARSAQKVSFSAN